MRDQLEVSLAPTLVSKPVQLVLAQLVVPLKVAMVLLSRLATHLSRLATHLSRLAPLISPPVQTTLTHLVVTLATVLSQLATHPAQLALLISRNVTVQLVLARPVAPIPTVETVLLGRLADQSSLSTTITLARTAWALQSQLLSLLPTLLSRNVTVHLTLAQLVSPTTMAMVLLTQLADLSSLSRAPVHPTHTAVTLPAPQRLRLLHRLPQQFSLLPRLLRPLRSLLQMMPRWRRFLSSVDH
jgi:hypothetical protein